MFNIVFLETNTIHKFDYKLMVEESAFKLFFFFFASLY